jgi:hypothetical protein
MAFGPSPDSLQYGGEVFRAASLFLRRVTPGAQPDTPPVRAPLLAGGVATALLLSRLPRLSVSLSDSPAGERMRRHFDDRICGVLHSRLAQGVLMLPQQQGQYLRGHSRQALRTNIHKAQAAGVECRPLEHLDQRRAATLQLRARVPGMLKWPDELFCRPGDVWWSARAPRGEAVALAQVTVDRDWAMLQSFSSSDRASRYLLHAGLVEMLVATGVRYLAVSAPMAPLLEPSLQYWQRLLGFDVVNLSVCRKPLAPASPPPGVGLAAQVDRAELEAELGEMLPHPVGAARS